MNKSPFQDDIPLKSSARQAKERARTATLPYYENYRNSPQFPNRKKLTDWKVSSRQSISELANRTWLIDRLNYATRLFSESVDISPLTRSGVPVLRGTRIPISQLLADIADGLNIQEVADDFGVDAILLKSFIDSISIMLDRPMNESVSTR